MMQHYQYEYIHKYLGTIHSRGLNDFIELEGLYLLSGLQY
jgi:hypothetical protein